MSHGITKFIAMVGLHFPRPKFSGDESMEAAWISSMTIKLDPYSDAILLQAAEFIITTRIPKKDGAFFPSPAECIAICERFVALEKKPQQLLLSAPSADEWSRDRVDLAFDLCKTPIGLQAARDGWVLGLHDFCRKHMRIPKTEIEIQKCIESSRTSNHIRENIAPKADWHVAVALKELADGIEKKNKEHAARLIANEDAA